MDRIAEAFRWAEVRKHGVPTLPVIWSVLCNVPTMNRCTDIANNPDAGGKMILFQLVEPEMQCHTVLGMFCRPRVEAAVGPASLAAGGEERS